MRVTGPVGTPIGTEIAVQGDTAVIELAGASGLALLPQRELAPMTASSFGTGELVRAALDASLPPGIDVLECVEAAEGGGSLADRIDAARWSIELPGIEPEHLSAVVAEFLARDEVTVAIEGIGSLSTRIV